MRWPWQRRREPGVVEWAYIRTGTPQPDTFWIFTEREGGRPVEEVPIKFHWRSYDWKQTIDAGQVLRVTLDAEFDKGIYKAAEILFPRTRWVALAHNGREMTKRWGLPRQPLYGLAASA